MSSGVALLVLGFLLTVFGIVIGSVCVITYSYLTSGYDCSISVFLPLAPLTLVIMGGGVFSMIIGTVFTAVGYSKGPKVETGRTSKVATVN